MYLFVDLSVRNNDKKARMVPPFKLVDDSGAEYQASSNGWAVQGSIGLLESLNPSVSKQGFVIFDVPQNRNYRLKLSGGYWAADDAFVQLTPKATKKAATKVHQERQNKPSANEKRQTEDKQEAKKPPERTTPVQKKYPFRTWTDSTGKHKTEARFRGILNGMVRLEKVDGKDTTLPLERLSDADREWVENRGQHQVK